MKRDLPPITASPTALATVARIGYLGPTIREQAAEKAAEDFDQLGDRVRRWLANEKRAADMHGLALAALSENDDDVRNRKAALREFYVYQRAEEYVLDVMEELGTDEEDRL